MLFPTLSVAAQPSIALSCVNTNQVCSITIRGFSIAPFKTAMITFEYSPAFNIGDALVSSLVSSAGVGASIDVSNHLLLLYISTTSKITIDNVDFLGIYFSQNENTTSSLSIKKATFTDFQGEVHTATILSTGSAPGGKSVFRTMSREAGTRYYYLVNGQKITTPVPDLWTLRAGIPLRVFMK